MSALTGFISMSLRFFRQRRGMRRELRPALERFPALEGLPDALFESWKDLAEPFHAYVTGVSAPVWAVSPQTAALVHALCRLLKPMAVLDFGSGFSSFAFRTYQRDAPHPCTVHSVDDDPHWLERTRTHLSSHGLPADSTYLWPEFQAGTAGRYDLVLHDMGRMNVRLETLPRVFDFVAPNGLLVLDDLHKAEYAPGALEYCRRAEFEVCALQTATMDLAGRYAGLAWRQRRD